MSLNIPASVYRDSTMPDLTDDQELLKLDLYNKIAPRRRKFIDRIGYENWDPFPKPNDPMEIRRDVSKRTTQELVREFLQSRITEESQGNGYRHAALEMALGIINRDEKFLGYFDFAMWYYDLLQDEGIMDKIVKVNQEKQSDKANQTRQASQASQIRQVTQITQMNKEDKANQTNQINQLNKVNKSN